MSKDPESPLTLNALLLLVLTALLSSHAMDLGQLGIVAWDTLIQGKPTQEKFKIEGGLLVAGTGLVILSVIGARNALWGGSVKDTNTVLASLVTGLLGLAFSILDKTANDDGVPTADTARGLIFVVIGSCVLLPPYLAMPSTSAGLRKATGTLARVGTAGLAALVLGLLVQLAFLAIAWACTGDCDIALESKDLKIGATSFFVSAPSAGAFAAAMAVLATDPWSHKGQWHHFGPGRRTIWLWGMVLVAMALSALYALGSYYPKHGEILNPDGTTRSGWLHAVPGAEIGLRGTVLLLWTLQIPTFLAAVLALCIGPRRPRSVLDLARGLTLIVAAATIGGAAGWAVTVQIAATERLPGKEGYFIAAHAATAITVVLGAFLSRCLRQPRSTGHVADPGGG